MAAALLVGLDVGTTSCKAGVFDLGGRLLALAAVPYPVSRPRPGWVEQDAEQYWQAAIACIGKLLETPGVEGTALAALASCGQTPTMLLLDEGGAPLRPAILWQDTRAGAEAGELARDPGTDALAEMMGLRWPVDASQPAARLRWLSRHEPGVLRRARLTLQPKDYVQLRLTGRPTTDPWSAKGLVHLLTHQPCAYLQDLCGVPPSIVPPVVASTSVIGQVTEDAARRTGLPAGLPVIAGWTDAMTAMLGTGAFGRPGLACDVSGTSEVIGLSLAARPAATGPLMAAPIADRPPDIAPVREVPAGEAQASGGRSSQLLTQSRAVEAAANASRWVLYGPTQCSGGSLGWVLRTLGLEGTAQAAIAAAAALPPGADGLLFLPYLEGERAPIWNPAARGAFVGLSSSHTPAHLVRAVLEGVACSVWHVLGTAQEVTGTRAAEVLVAGGGARQAAWNQIKADVAGTPLRACTVSENGVLGAAMLAAVGAGLYADVTAAGDAMVRHEAPVVPDPGRRAAYERLFARYAALYPRLQELPPA